MDYYNENDPECVAWLRELIKGGLIPNGKVDDRSIEKVAPKDLRGFRRCHFFAGIGGWAHALTIASWNGPCWTASCPCQPFSGAGKRRGYRDRRHLWPVLKELIAQRGPTVVFGEQVASKTGRLWLARVRTEVEALEFADGQKYAIGAADLCAAGISAPHIRQRIFWVADAYVSQRSRKQFSVRSGNEKQAASDTRRNGEISERLDYAKRKRWEEGRNDHKENVGIFAAAKVEAGFGMVHANGCHGQWWSGPLQVGRNCIEAEVERGGRKFGAQWRVKPGLSLLANGIPGRVAQLRGFGNAIVPQLAAEFVAAFAEIKSR